MVDDWDITHRRARPAAAGVGFPKIARLLRDDHPEAQYGGLEFSAYAHSCVLAKIASRSAHGVLDGRRAQLPGSGRAAQSLRHRRAEELLPAAARARRGGAVLRAHRSARRLRRRRHSRYRHRLPRHVERARDPRHPPQLLQALHYARAHGDGHRSCLSHVRSAAPARRQGRSRHHLRARFRAPRRASASAGGISRSIFRFRTGRSRGRTCSCRSMCLIGGAQDGRPRLAHAGRAALGRALHLSALQRHRRCAGGDLGHGRVCAHPPAIQHADRSFRGRRDGDRADGRAHLHHGCGALGHRRRDRWRREALRALGDAQVSRHGDGAAGRERRHGRARRQGHLPGTRRTILHAATRSCRSPSPSRARTC